MWCLFCVKKGESVKAIFELYIIKCSCFIWIHRTSSMMWGWWVLKPAGFIRANSSMYCWLCVLSHFHNRLKLTSIDSAYESLNEKYEFCAVIRRWRNMIRTLYRISFSMINTRLIIPPTNWTHNIPTNNMPTPFNNNRETEYFIC